MVPELEFGPRECKRSSKLAPVKARNQLTGPTIEPNRPITSARRAGSPGTQRATE